MMLRIKVRPAPELAKTVFVADSRVLEYRRVEIDLRSFSALSNLTDYGRDLLWEDFYRSDSHAWERVGEITTSNFQAFSEDAVVLSEWVNHLFKAACDNLNSEWRAVAAQAEEGARQQREIDLSILQGEDPPF